MLPLSYFDVNSVPDSDTVTDPWQLTFAVVVSIVALILTLGWSVVWSVVSFRRSGPVVRVSMSVKADLLSPPEDEAEIGGSGAIPAEVWMPVSKWPDYVRDNPGSEALNPKVVLSAVNIGRAVTSVRAVGIRTSRTTSHSRSAPSDFPFVLSSGGSEFEWSARLSEIHAWCKEDDAGSFRGEVVLTSGKRRHSRPTSLGLGVQHRSPRWRLLVLMGVLFALLSACALFLPQSREIFTLLGALLVGVGGLISALGLSSQDFRPHTQRVLTVIGAALIANGGWIIGSTALADMILPLAAS
jgi:hypothetical protein